MKLLFERILLEAHYDKEAAQMLVDASLFDTLEEASKFIDTLRKPTRDSEGNVTRYAIFPVFEGAPGPILKYLKAIARLIKDECGGNRAALAEFMNNDEYIWAINEVLKWARENRPKLAEEGQKPDKLSPAQIEMDENILKKWDMTKFIQKATDLEEERENAETDVTGSMEDSNYEIVPIDSYEQMHDMFGGKKTGNGTDHGQSYSPIGGAWCHTNGGGTYKSWVDSYNGYRDNQFFVLAKRGWESVPVDIGTNYGKNEYGHSLMALLVNKKKGNLLACTLRCNHEGISGGGFEADHAYKTYPELSEIAGFDVGKWIKDYLGIKPIKIRNGVVTYTGCRIIDMDGFDETSDIDKILKVVIPEGTEKIVNGAFTQLIKLTEVTIPESVTEIGVSAFENCKSLISVNLPNSLKSIGEKAFEKCSSLGNIVIPDSVESMGERAFEQCSALRSIKFSNLMELVPGYACNECKSLVDVVLGESMTNINTGAFSNCISLKKLVLPENMSNVTLNAFSGCDGVVIETSSRYVYGRLNRRQENDPNCGYNVKYISKESTGSSEHVYYQGVRLDSMYSPEELANIKYVTIKPNTRQLCAYAFAGCVNLLGFTYQSDFSKLEEIENNAFDGCEHLVVFDLERLNLWWLGDNAFRNCKSLIYMGIPEGIDNIASGLFAGCTNLQKVSLNDTVSIIDEGAFEDSGIVTIDGTKKVSSIKNNAFKNCKNLRLIAFGNERFNNIGRDVFAGCDSLEGVYCVSDKLESYCRDNNIPCVRTDREGR